MSRLIDAEYVLWKVQSEAFPQSVDFGQGRESVLDEIRKAPTVDAEPVKHGKWIDMSDGGAIRTTWWGSWKCDQCGKWGREVWDYCPHCGSRNRKE